MLPMNHLMNVFKRSVKEYGQDDVADLAAALAFAAFFSIFPLILFLVSLASFILDPNSAREFVISKLPNIQQGGQDANFLSKTVTDIVASRGAGTGIAAIVGLISLLMSASGVFGTLQKAINRAWDCEKEGSLIKDKVVAFLMVLGVAAVMVVSTIISSILNGVQSGTAGIIGQLPLLWQFVNLLVSIGLMTGVLTILYRTLPRCKVNWADVWPGALVAAVLMEILKQGFAFYLGHFANYQAVYGTLGAVIALQTWIFLMSQILLFGAEFCSEYAGERQGIEAARATAANTAAAEQRQAEADRKAQTQRAEDAARAREIARRRERITPVAAPAREHGVVLAAAAGLAAAIGLIGKALGSRGAQR
jgi:membrane protein